MQAEDAPEMIEIVGVVPLASPPRRHLRNLLSIKDGINKDPDGLK